MMCPADVCRRSDGEVCEEGCAVADGTYAGPLGPLPGEAPSYAAHRHLRMAIAERYEGWDRPDYPFLTEAGRTIGRVFILPFRWQGKKLLGLVPTTSLLDAEMKAREKRQNRERLQ